MRRQGHGGAGHTDRNLLHAKMPGLVPGADDWGDGPDGGGPSA